MITLLPNPQPSPALLQFLDVPGIDYDDWIGDDVYVEPVDLPEVEDTDFFSIRIAS